MNVELEVTGGARIGWVKATWPLAKLSASAQQLSVSGVLLGRYDFSPDQVAALEPYGVIPVLGKGVRIIHTVESYPDKIIFWCVGSPGVLIDRITALGFQPKASLAQVPQRDGIAFRWSFLILLLATWSALFVMNGFTPWQTPGPYTLLAPALLLLTALALNLSNRFQTLALKPGRSISEVRPLALLVLVISVGMLVAVGAQHIMKL